MWKLFLLNGSQGDGLEIMKKYLGIKKYENANRKSNVVEFTNVLICIEC